MVLHRSLAALLCAASSVTVLPLRAQQPAAAFSSFNDWLGADAHGVRIGADGRLRLAPGLRRVAQLPEGVVWCALPDGTGGAYLSAGNEGKIFRYANGQLKPLGQVKGGVVFAMARVGQDLVLAPSGEGKLYRMTPTGDVKPWCEIDSKLVWALMPHGSELLVAGAGEKGALLLLARENSSRKLAELPEESAFTAITPDPAGGWYLGTHGHGLVLRLPSTSGEARPETLLATGFEEVRALLSADGQLFVGATNGLASRMAANNLERREGYLAEVGSTTRGAVIRLDRGRVPETLWSSAQSQVFALCAWKDQILVGTGNRSRIFAIPASEKGRDADPFSVLQDLGTAQASAFLQSGSELMVVGSNPAELHVMSDSQATEGTLESRILKGLPIADWGRSYLDVETATGTGVDLQFRVGATETPDSTWSPWTPPLQSGERPNLKPSRFAQFRLRLTSARGGATPMVEGVRVHWANRNLAPVWEGVDVMPAGLVITRSAPAEDIGIERVPLDTQKLIPALGYMGSEKRSFRRGAQAFVFRANDPNADALSFRIALLPQSGSPIELEKAWKERFFTFDTLPVPDGRYRLEVTASDAPAQPFNQAQTSTWRTAPFVIDHTPPVINELSAVTEGDGVRVRFAARDETSLIKDAAISVDGENWLQIAPEDRIFDNKEERFEVVIPRERLKGDRVLVKVSDMNNNEQTASTGMTAPKKR